MIIVSYNLVLFDYASWIAFLMNYQMWRWLEVTNSGYGTKRQWPLLTLTGPMLSKIQQQLLLYRVTLKSMCYCTAFFGGCL